MSDKEVVLELVRSLPDAVSLAGILEEIEILAAIRRGEEAADRGDLVPHEEVRKRIESWLTGSTGLAPHSTTSEASSKT